MHVAAVANKGRCVTTQEHEGEEAEEGAPANGSNGSNGSNSIATNTATNHATNTAALHRAIERVWDLRPQTVAAAAAGEPRQAPVGVGVGAGAGSDGSVMGGGAAGYSHPPPHAANLHPNAGHPHAHANADAKGRRGGGGRLLGALLLPLVQRLFVGVFADFSVALFLWDVLMARGTGTQFTCFTCFTSTHVQILTQQALVGVLPWLCAVCLHMFKGPLAGHVSDTGTWASLQKSLNLAAKAVKLWEVQRAVHIYVFASHASATPAVPPLVSTGLLSVNRFG
jgi:hypothetical protein